MKQNNNSNYNQINSNMMSGGTTPQIANNTNFNNINQPNVYNPYQDINNPVNLPTLDEINSGSNQQNNFQPNPQTQQNINNTNYISFNQQDSNSKYFGYWGPELKKNN